MRAPVSGAIAGFGLKKGDVILRVNNETVDDINFIRKKSNIFETTKKLKSIIVWRNQKKITLKQTK